MRVALLLVLVGCSYGKAVPSGPDGSASGDAAGGCTINFDFQPPANPSPHAGSGAVERVTATTNLDGVPQYSWFVTFNGVTGVPTTPLGDGGAIDFPIDNAGIYDISLQVTSSLSGGFCSQDFPLNVVSGGANVTSYRARVAPPQPTLPAMETNIQVLGGADQQINLAYPQLSQVTGTVLYQGSGTLAYVRIAPPGSAAYVESFTAGNGQFDPVTVLGGAEEVLVVPLVPGPAPKLFHWNTTQTPVFSLDDGSPVTGTVTSSTGAGIANAKVQLLLGGRLPSTIATTQSDGSFTLQADETDPNLVASVRVDVTPPASSGLPRLARTDAIDVTSPIAVHYNALATRDVNATPVKQGGTSIANATVVFAGSVGGAGTIAGGAADDTIHVAAKTDGNGKIAASTLVPAKPVSIVATFSTGEVELASVDLTSGVPASFALPSQATSTGSVTQMINQTVTPLGGVRVELVPIGDLATAGVQPTQAVTSSGGTYTAHLATNGLYDVRVVDPNGRAPLFTASAQSPAQIADFPLAPGIHVTGLVTLPDLSVVSNASVQFLCTDCTDVLRPVAESSTDINGQYRVGVPDPGVN